MTSPQRGLVAATPPRTRHSQRWPSTGAASCRRPAERTSSTLSPRSRPGRRDGARGCPARSARSSRAPASTAPAPRQAGTPSPGPPTRVDEPSRSAWTGEARRDQLGDILVDHGDVLLVGLATEHGVSTPAVSRVPAYPIVAPTDLPRLYSTGWTSHPSAADGEGAIVPRRSPQKPATRLAGRRPRKESCDGWLSRHRALAFPDPPGDHWLR